MHITTNGELEGMLFDSHAVSFTELQKQQLIGSGHMTIKQRRNRQTDMQTKMPLKRYLLVEITRTMQPLHKIITTA